MDQNAINEYIEKDLIDFEFLDEYSDNHPPESIKFLDKKIDEMVGNIASLLESRKKDFQNTPGRKDRLPVQPDTNFYENYQESRKEKLKDALHVEIPVQKYTSSQLVSKQLEIYWDVNKEFRIDNIRKLLRNFFKTKAYSCIQENFLLLSRWSRFCKSTSEPTKYKLQFQKHVQYLKKEFLDSIDRYERINECVVKKDALIKEAAILKQKDLEKNERLGFAVNRRSSMKPMIEKGNEKEDKKNITPVMREVTEEIKLEANDLEVGDLAIYLRHLISTYKPIQTMDLFLTRAKMLSIADREYWLKDYHLISHLKPGVPNDLPTYKFEGFDNFTEKFPLKNPRLEDFLNEFETLVTAFGIETQIGREDGRPFAFEIATKFSKLFSLHQKENLLPPYDFYFEDLTFSNSNPNVIQPASSEIGRGTKKPETYNPRINWSDLMDEKTRATFINPTTLRLRQADWLDQNEYFPRLEIWQERQKAILQSQKEIDFEVGYEYDLLLCNDIEVVKQKLREAAKGLCEIEDDSTYRKNKVNLNKQQGEETETDRISEFEECLRNKKPFDYGMLITDSRNTNEVDIVLEAKRLFYQTLCQKNEEIKRIEQELLELDPTRAGSVGQQIEPATVSNVFAEHEIFSFLLLKDLKIREHRSSLLNQLNFFRSIEKRICHDTKFLQQMKNTTFTDHMDKPYQGNVKVASFMSNMWKNQYFFDASDQSFCETSSISSFLDDIRIIHNNKIFVMDSNDTRFIYDVAVKDLKELEKEIIKIATIFINSDSLGNEKVSKKYMETLKFKLADRRVDSTVSTFYNPEIDRAQLLMELYDYECKFGNAKVQLVNLYMEALEHTTTFENSKKLSQIIIDIIYLRPNLNFKSKFFSKQYLYHTKALLSQGDTVMKILKHHIKENRGVINKYFFKLHKAMLDPDMEYPFELTDDKENFDFSKFIDTPLTIGLPLKPEKEKEMITMHQSGVSVFFGEFSSALDKIAEVYECSRYCLVEMSQALEQITSNDSTDLGSIECIIWKNFNTIWSSFALQNFESWKSKKIDRITSYENESGWFENPLFPDAFLSEKYSLFKSNQKEQWNKEGLFSAFTMFNDPSFQTKGCSFLINMLKLLTLKKRLFLTGTESEFWKKTFENQCLQMGVSKKGIVGKLCPLKFDLLDFVDIKNLDEDDIECGESDGEDEVFEQKSVEAFNVSLKCGPLAISEIDESLGSLAGSSFSEIFDALKEPFLEKLSRALKIQLIEMYNCLAVSQMNSHILCEINLKYLTEGYPSKEKKMALKKKPNGKDTIELQRFDFDYKALIPSLLSKKKFVRKCCLQEYVKEYKKMFIEDDGLSDARKMEATTWLKARIIDWYYENMTHAVIEECERAEFASLNVGLSRAAANSPSGKILFVNSKYKRHAQFFEADNKREEIADSEEPKTSKCQSVFLDDEVITQLWYLPHLTEILVKVTENLSQPNDISELAYENSGIWSKALQLHYLVYDIYNIVQIFAQMIQNNSKNSSAVCQLRVSEFVYNTMGAIKADLTTMGQRVDYNRVLNYLIGKWQFWMLKIRFAISFVKYSLTLNLKEHSLKVLTATASRYSYSNNYLFLDSTTFDYSNFPLLYPQVQISIQVSHAPTHHYFLGLANEKEKNFCSSKIIEVENLMQDFNQYNLTGNFESINKSQVEFIKGNWKLLQARLEYMKLENNGIRILDESGLEDFFRRYKSRVLAEAVKIYCKQGARGSANPLCFLKTEILTNPLRAEVSRIAQVTFDRYQLNVLSEELLRLYTYNCFTAIKCYYEKLSDERSGRLFKSVSLIKPSTTGDANFGFHISEEDYNAKSALLNNFVNDLHAHYSKFLRDNRDSKTNTWKVKDSKTGPFNAELVFMIPKEALNKAIGKMGLELSKYYALRVAEKESFLESLYDRMLEIIKSNERFIEHILKEKNYMVENLKREVRLESSHKISEFLSEMAVLSIELNDLKKLRKVDEKKIRQSITDEYDDLVRELVHELHLMKNRFNEFRNSAVNEVLNIMSDSKKEELSIIVNTMDVSKYIKQQAQNAIEQENISQKFKAENFELKNTLIKIKSMYTLKETALRTSFDKKIRALTEENKQAEEKLWDSYREADARELVLKKQLTKLQKNQINTDVELELSRKRGQEEKTFVESSNHNNNQLGLQQSSVIQQQNQKIQELQEKLTKYEGVNVKLLIHELSEKTRILEELIDDKQYLESCLQDLGYSNLVANRKPPSKSHKNISLRSRPNTASFKSRPTTAKGRLQRSLPEVHFNSAEKKSIYDSLKLKSVSSTSVNQTGNQQQNIMTDAPIVINYIGNETTDAFDSTNIRGSVSDNYRYHKAQVLSVEYIATDEVGEESEPYYPPGNDFRGDSVTAKQDESLRSEIETSLILDHLKNNARIDMDLNIVPNSSIRGSSVIAPVKKLSCNDLFISTKPQERRATSVNSIGNLDRGAPNVRKTAFTANVNETVGCSPKLKVGRPKSAFPNVLRTAGDIPCVPRTAKTNSSDYQIKTSFSKKK